MDGAFETAAFTDDRNNLHQTIADSLQSNSRAATANAFCFRIMKRSQWAKKTVETTSAAEAPPDSPYNTINGNLNYPLHDIGINRMVDTSVH